MVPSLFKGVGVLEDVSLCFQRAEFNCSCEVQLSGGCGGRMNSRSKGLEFPVNVPLQSAANML